MEEHERRLLLIADKLDVVATMPPARFNFARWVGHDWKGLPDLSCGTSACALGHASTIPELQALGLGLIADRRSSGHVCVFGKEGNFDDDLKNVADLFGLTRKEFDFLFIPFSHQGDSALEEQENVYGRIGPGPNATAKEVADHIRAFVQHKYH